MKKKLYICITILETTLATSSFTLKAMSAPGGGLQDLNALPLPSTDIDDTDVAFNPDDLAIFTNTRFFDFDIGPDDRRNHNREGGDTGRTDLIDPELKNGGMDFLNGKK